MFVWQDKQSVSRLEKCDTSIIVVDGKAYKLTVLDGQVSAKVDPA